MSVYSVVTSHPLHLHGKSHRLIDDKKNSNNGCYGGWRRLLLKHSGANSAKINKNTQAHTIAHLWDLQENVVKPQCNNMTYPLECMEWKIWQRLRGTSSVASCWWDSTVLKSKKTLKYSILKANNVFLTMTGPLCPWTLSNMTYWHKTTSVTTPASLDGGLQMPHFLLRSYWKLMASGTGSVPSLWEGRWLLVGCCTLVDEPTDIGIWKALI